MTPADEERLRSWVFEIVETLIEGVAWRQEGAEKRAVGQAGLTINVKSGAWYSHGLGRGHWSTIPLIELLRNCDRNQALSWAEAWLQAHPGTGSIGDAGDADDDNTVPGSAAYARDLLTRTFDPAGTVAETYLRSRAIRGTLPSCIRFVPDARIGESALAGILTSHGRTTAIMLRYLDPIGRPSTIMPARRRFNIEKSEAVFEVQAASNVVDLTTDTLIAEGLEDGLSLAELGRPVRIVALPGIAALRHVPVRPGERIIICADGDLADSAAHRTLIAGTDALLLQGAVVRVTETPSGDDANSILQSGGVRALADLVEAAVPAELSNDGRITWASRLDQLSYDRERKRIADRLEIRLSTLDAEVSKRRGTKSTASQPAANSDDVDGIELLDDPVELRETLDDTLTELQRYIVADKPSLAAVALWCAHTHLCHHEHIRLQRSPRLAIQARTPGAGKTTLLEAIGALVPRPRVAAS